MQRIGTEDGESGRPAIWSILVYELSLHFGTENILKSQPKYTMYILELA